MRKHLILLLNLMCIALFFVSLLILNKAPLISLCCLVWAVFYFNKTKKSILQFRAFTLLELVAVLGLVAVLASITLSLSTNKMKAESVQLKSLLTQAKTYSYSNGEEVIKFTYTEKFTNNLNPSHELFFKKGIPVNNAGKPLIGFKYVLSDHKQEEKYIVIKIKPFTGKITFY